MYISRELITNETMFKMPSGKFNELCNSLKQEQEEGDIKVNVAVLTRTDSTNEVMKVGDSYLLTKEVNNDHTGYFSLAKACGELLTESVHAELKDIVKKTVLLPCGCFMYRNELYFYFNLIIKPEIKDYFNYTFNNIDIIKLLDVPNIDIIILPTLVITSK